MEAIRAKRRQHGRWEYLIKWEGYESDVNSWEPREHVGEEAIQARAAASRPSLLLLPRLALARAGLRPAPHPPHRPLGLRLPASGV